MIVWRPGLKEFYEKNHDELMKLAGWCLSKHGMYVGDRLEDVYNEWYSKRAIASYRAYNRFKANIQTYYRMCYSRQLPSIVMSMPSVPGTLSMDATIDVEENTYHDLIGNEDQTIHNRLTVLDIKKYIKKLSMDKSRHGIQKLNVIKKIQMLGIDMIPEVATELGIKKQSVYWILAEVRKDYHTFVRR